MLTPLDLQQTIRPAMRIKPDLGLLLFLILFSLKSSAQPLEERFKPLPAPKPSKLLLQPGDRLAICGDSITEQKMYSRIMEDYLTVCVPDLHVTVRQYGWSGERAPGFLARMTNDCLRFRPTIATTCYGMNDHEYRTYEDRIGKTYEQNSTAIVEAFKAHGARVVQGSPGCIGKVPFWTKTTNATIDDLNVNLCNLRNIGVEIAQKEKVGFADVFWPMLTAGKAAQEKYATNYNIAGNDGVHPGWAGHTVMAYAFLKGLGLDGEIGTYALKLKSNKLSLSRGHKVVSSKPGEFEIESSRYPFSICEPAGGAAALYPECGKDDPSKDSNIRSATTLIPFNEELNRLTLIVSDAGKPSYKVTWGSESKQFSGDQLRKGVNLAAEFPVNPFSTQFAKVDAAVAAKQAFETKQIKTLFHSREAKTNMVAIVESSEKERQPLADAIKAAFIPVTHKITVVAE
jgi:lysophospholipase L1-like esterase